MFCSKFIQKILRGLCFALGLAVLSTSFTSYADKEDDIAANQAMTVESNTWDEWPTGPIVSAKAAILMEAETGTILYAKNIHSQEYPASTTKILTSLIAIENCKMDDMVTFSWDAVHDIDPGSNHIAIDVGEQLSIEDCLKAILIRSANEVSFAVAEHIAGGHWETFSTIMNERARELGALNSNFVNPNGLPNEEHVTTAYDLAMIGRAFFANEILCKITLTKQLHLYPTETQPDEIWENNQMSLLPGKEYAYDYIVGCKTGYTNDARSCLVSCAEKDGMKLICVVLRDESPYQYEDTISLFEYGFSNFEKRSVAQNETQYNIGNDTFLYSGSDIFGNSQPILALNQSDYVVLPKTADFEDMDSTISYDTESETEAALITYTYHGVNVGTASIDFALGKQSNYQFEISTGEDLTSPIENTENSNTSKNNPTADDITSFSDKTDENTTDESPSFIFVNIEKILIVVGIVIGILIIILIIMMILKNYQFNSPQNNRRLRTSERKRRTQYYNSVSPDLRRKRRQQIADAKRRQRKARRH